LGVDFVVGRHGWEVGAASFLHSFFSTISYHLEPRGWGTKYPELMTELHDTGQLSQEHASKVITDLHEIRAQLSRLSPERIIWTIDDLKMHPPWGDQMAPTITNLANYFITSDGQNLFDVLLAALEELSSKGEGVLQIE